MKRLLLLIALLLPIAGWAVPVADVTVSVEAGFDAANKLYAQSKFAEAATAYEKLIAAGSYSPALFFNLGNARFKSGQIGLAIAAYRHAEEMSPRDPDVRANVQFARKQVQGPTLHMGWLRQWLGNLSGNEWVALSTAGVWITFCLLIARMLKPSLTPALRSWTMVAIIGTLLIFTCTKLATSQSRSDKIAIVTQPDVSVRNGPFDESPSTVTAHDGAELRVLDTKGDWYQVTDGGNKVGWLRRETVFVSSAR